MRLLRTLTLRSMAAHPMRLLLSGFGVVLGVAAILAIGTVNRAALSSVTSLMQDSSGKSALTVASADSGAGGVPERLQPRLANLPGVAAAVPVLHLQTVLLGDAASPDRLDLSFFGAGMGGLLLDGIDPALDPLARTYSLTAGEFLLPGSDSYHVVLVEDYARENKIEPGDTIDIGAPEGPVELRVVGLIAREGPGRRNNGAFGVLPLPAAQRIAARLGRLDAVDIVAAAGVSPAALRESLQAALGAEYSVTFPAEQGRRMTQMLGNYQIGLNFLSAMALFVGAFLIYNAFSMTVVERTREFGLLRSVGMTRSQVTRQVLAEAAVLGIAGSLLGLGLGVLLARGLSGLVGSMLAQDAISIDVPRDLALMSGGVGLLAALLAALLPALQAGRISPLEALRVRASAGEGRLVRFGWIPGAALLVFSAVILVLNPFPYDPQFRLGSLVVFTLFLGGALMIPPVVAGLEKPLRPLARFAFGSSGSLGSSNIRRMRSRTSLTTAALMIGVAMIVIVWVMTDSFKSDLDDWLKGYIGGDLYVTSSVSMRPNVQAHLESVAGVAAVAPVRYMESKLRLPSGSWETIAWMAVDPARHSRVTGFLFSQAPGGPGAALDALARGESVFVSSVLAERFDLRPGDSIRISTPGGDRSFRVAAVVVDYYNQGMTVIGSWQDLNAYFRERNAAAFLLKAAPGYDIDRLQREITARFGDRDRLTILSNHDLLARVSTLMDQAFSLFDVLALIAVLVGFMGIANTMTMNVIERTREIGMLRAIGMTRSQVARMVLAEAGQVGLIGGVLGIGFGALLARIFMLAMTAMSGYSLQFALPAGRVLWALAVALIVSQLASLLPALRAARLRLLESIQYE